MDHFWMMNWLHIDIQQIWKVRYLQTSENTTKRVPFPALAGVDDDWAVILDRTHSVQWVSVCIERRPPRFWIHAGGYLPAHSESSDPNSPEKVGDKRPYPRFDRPAALRWVRWEWKQHSPERPRAERSVPPATVDCVVRSAVVVTIGSAGWWCWWSGSSDGARPCGTADRRTKNACEIRQFAWHPSVCERERVMQNQPIYTRQWWRCVCGGT